ncbi:MAG: ParA family protein [Calditrichaeota bacterium]|nr:MAG: ParA family protein [Calditrichota bacterium]
MKKIAVLGLKGGIGKTTTTVNLGAALAEKGRRVLLVDLDPQANLTLALGFQAVTDLSLAQFLVNKASFHDVVRFYNKNLHCIPASGNLAKLDRLLIKLHEENPFRPFVLKRAFARVPACYDFVLFDCPPSRSMLTINALSLADEVYMPIQCHYFALESCRNTISLINSVKSRFNPLLTLSRVVPVMGDPRKHVTKNVLRELRLIFGDSLSHTLIRENIALVEAQGKRLTIFDHDIRCHGAEDYAALAEEVLSQMNAERTLLLTA